MLLNLTIMTDIEILEKFGTDPPIRVYSFIMSYLVIFDGTTAFVGDHSDIVDADHEVVGTFTNENVSLR